MILQELLAIHEEQLNEMDFNFGPLHIAISSPGFWKMLKFIYDNHLLGPLLIALAMYSIAYRSPHGRVQWGRFNDMWDRLTDLSNEMEEGNGGLDDATKNILWNELEDMRRSLGEVLPDLTDEDEKAIDKIVGDAQAAFRVGKRAVFFNAVKDIRKIISRYDMEQFK